MKAKNDLTVGLILPYLKSRGTERQALHIATCLKKQKINVVLFVIQGWGLETMYSSFEKVGVNVINIGKSNKENIFNKTGLFHIFSLIKFIKKYKCGLLLSRAQKTNHLASFVGKMLAIPTITVVSSSLKREDHGLFKSIANKALVYSRYNFASKIVFVSAEGANNFNLTYPQHTEKVTHIPNGVSINLHDPESNQSVCNLSYDKFTLCYSGSIHIHRKGLDILLKSLQTLVFSYKKKNIQLHIIGTGSDKNKFDKMINDLHLREYVFFLGEKTDPSPYISKCDVFVLPSRFEGLPNSLLEAMMLEVCCIASDCDTGPREIIKNGENGILVPTENSELLSKALNEIIENPSLRKKMAKNGRIYAEKRYSLETMCKKYTELILKTAKL